MDLLSVGINTFILTGNVKNLIIIFLYVHVYITYYL